MPSIPIVPKPGSGLVSGREFSDADVAGAPLVAIISEAIARVDPLVAIRSD
jgi:hypothetical protein